MSEILQKRKPIIFVGQKEMGKTTLLHFICNESNRFSFQDVPRFSTYVDLSNVRPSRAGILEAIVGFSKGEYRRAEFIQLLRDGRMTVCFDNLPAMDEKLLTLLETFIKEFPENRYFFAIQEDLHSSLTQKGIPRLGLETQVIYLHSFARKQTRSLVSKWFSTSIDANRETADRLLSSLKRLNIPRTPFTISILLWVLERNVAFSPVNHSEIMDVLIDGLLEKLHEHKGRANLDANVKRHFLTELAHTMHTSKRRRLTQHELEQFAVGYFEMKLLPSSSAPFLQELVAKGVLREVADEVEFKFDCYRSFFLSIKLRESQDLLDYALTAAGFYEFREELDYFTGRHRDQAAVLRRSMILLDEEFAAVDMELPLSLFDEFTIEGSPITAERRDSIEKQMFGQGPSVEKREHLLDEIDERTGIPDAPLSPATTVATPSKVARYISALQTASKILRNSELIDDPELKRTAYAQISGYWCQLLIAILAIVELHADKEELDALSKSLSAVPEVMRGYIVKMILPNAIFAYAYECLGTEKLQLVLEDSLSNADESLRRLLGTFLYADLEMPKRVTYLRRLAETAEATRFLLELVLFKLMHLFMFRQLRDGEELQIKTLAADLFTRINNISDKRTRDATREKLMNYLDRRKLFTALAEEGEETENFEGSVKKV